LLLARALHRWRVASMKLIPLIAVLSLTLLIALAVGLL
jgi:hypothetical protein